MKKVILALMLAGVVCGASASGVEGRLCKNFGDAVEITHAHAASRGMASAGKLWESVPADMPPDQRVMYARWATSVVVMAETLRESPNKTVAHSAEYFCVMQDMPSLMWKRK